MRRVVSLAVVAVMIAGCGGGTAPEGQIDPDPGTEGETEEERERQGETSRGDDDASEEDDASGDDDDASGDGSADDALAAIAEADWEELPQAPIATRINHTATWSGDRLLVWGGQDQDTMRITADGAALDPASGDWEELPEAPIEPRWGHEAVWTGDELLVWGGSAGPDHLAECFADGARYDPEAGEWQRIPDAPGGARCGSSVAWSGEELLVFGGYPTNPPQPGDRHDDGVAYDPDADQWRELPAAPTGPRASSAAAWTGDHLVVYGGHSAAEDGDGFEYHADGAVYDPASDEWSQIDGSPLPPLNGIAGVALDGELLVVGGQAPDIGEEDYSTAAVSYDPAEDRWTTRAELPGANTVLEAASVDGLVHLVGGGLPEPADEQDGAAAPDAEEAAAHLVYDPEADRWVEGPQLPGGHRRNHALAAGGGQVLLWGGQLEAEPRPTGLRFPLADQADAGAGSDD